MFTGSLLCLLVSENIEFLVINAQHIKFVTGRRIAINDTEWIAKLLRYGLLKASFIPDRNQRDLRELVRYHRSMD
ncbi:transposase [Bacillus salitolerans]|uniref:Transposase n=1 Tax=Bacillus salitolerans TaxID=1437434 RepID=A0ABW4LPY4_9BACI